jgi:hypothetical protein
MASGVGADIEEEVTSEPYRLHQLEKDFAGLFVGNGMVNVSPVGCVVDGHAGLPGTPTFLRLYLLFRRTEVLRFPTPIVDQDVRLQLPHLGVQFS